MIKQIPKSQALIGRCITALDPTVIGAENYQGLKNFYYHGTGIRGVGGMTKINTSVMDATYLKTRSAFHFLKDQPAESHVIAQAYNTGLTDFRLLTNETAIASQGNFNSTVLFTPSSGAGKGKFSLAPNSQMAYANGIDVCIWGGYKSRIARFINEDADDTTLEDFWDYTEKLQNSDADETAVLKNGSGGTPKCTFYVGSTRPLGGTAPDGTKRGVFFDVSVVNALGVTFTVKYWDGSAWQAVGGASDGTLVGGATLAQDGWYAFNDTVSVAKPRIYKGIYLYWYQFQTSGAVTATTALKQVQIYMPFQSILDLWDGKLRMIMNCSRWDAANSKWEDLTAYVSEKDYSEDTSTYVRLGDKLTSANDYLLLGFTEQQLGLEFHLQTANTAAVSITVKYWNGSAWTSVGTVTDGTAQGTVTLSKTGKITWNPLVLGTELKYSLNNFEPMYYYQLSVSAGLTAGSAICDYIAGITAQKPIGQYKFTLFADDALWLCSRQDDKKNTVRRSMKYAPDVYNGEDSWEREIGDENELTAGASLYSRLASNIYDIKVFFKETSMYGVSGYKPADYTVYPISHNIGCIAPETLRQAIAYIGGIPRPILIWQSANGIYIFDNTSPIRVSDDIQNFFDKNESASRKLHTSYSDLSYSFIDEEKLTYHWLFADGNSTGTLNREWVLCLKTLRWSEIDRGTGKYLQCGYQVRDTVGNTYTYGFIDTGYMERLENGTDFDGTAIAHNLWLADEAPFGEITEKSQLVRYGLVMVTKSTTGQVVAVTHYGDGVSTGTILTSIDPTKSGYRIVVNDLIIDPADSGAYVFHSLRFQISTTDETWGFEPLFIQKKYQLIGSA